MEHLAHRLGKNGTKIIKLFLRFFFLYLFFQCSFVSVQAQSRKVKQAERKYDQQIKQEKKDYDKRRKATIKHRYEIQSKDVQERMKNTEERSRKYGRKQKDPFYKNIFSKKKKKPRRKRHK